MNVRHTSAALLVTIVAAGCTSGPAADTPASPRSFASTREIVAALDRGGIECREFQRLDPLWKEEARCVSVEGDVRLRIFGNEEESAKDRKIITDLHESEPARGLYGPGWAVITPNETDFIRDAQRLLGGEIVKPEGGAE